MGSVFSCIELNCQARRVLSLRTSGLFCAIGRFTKLQLSSSEVLTCDQTQGRWDRGHIFFDMEA